jgi:hypothetical protein
VVHPSPFRRILEAYIKIGHGCCILYLVPLVIIVQMYDIVIDGAEKSLLNKPINRFQCNVSSDYTLNYHSN